MRILPGDNHNPPLAIHNIETVQIERHGSDGRLVKVTLPPGRNWVVLPADLFATGLL